MSRSDSTEASLQPLRVRAGARFTCHGDGLCCTDVHALGPLSDDEVRLLSSIDEQVVVKHGGDRVLTQRVGGGCIFLGEGRCELHAAFGPDVKPRACRQFPFVFVATPNGGRVATEHRCPCRTMGEREPVTAEDALAVMAGKTAERIIRSTLPVDGSQKVPITEWEAMEAPLLARLEAGEDPATVLDCEPFTTPAEGSWEELGIALVSETSENRFCAAQRRFGATLLRLRGAEVEGVDEALPWADAFDRAEKRSEPGDPEAIYRDWIADYVWSLEWAFTGSFAQARAELATRLAVARAVANDLERDGCRPDRAAAEAVAVAELAGVADAYHELVAQLPD